MARVTIVKKGWEGANNNVPIILCDKATRRAIGVEDRDSVRVTHNGVTVLAYCTLQFRQDVGRGATVNDALARALILEAGNTVDVAKVIDTEAPAPQAPATDTGAGEV